MSTISATAGRSAMFMSAIALYCSTGSLSTARGDEFLVEAMTQVLEAANGLEGQSDLGYDVNGHTCVLGAFIAPGESVSLVRPFSAGRRYAVLAGGDRDANDIDIRVLDANGHLMTEDADADASPAVSFYPVTEQMCEIQITLYSAVRSSFVFVAILSEGGYHVPPQNQIEAAAQLLTQYQMLSGAGSTSLLNTSGNWAVYGSILEGGENMTIDNVGLGHGRRIIMTGSDQRTSDLDLYVQVNEMETVQLSDIAEDSVPVIDGQFFGDLHRLRLQNSLTGGASTFVLTGIVQLN